MKYETTEHRAGTSQANQSRGETAKAMAIEFESNQKIGRGIWDIPASSVSLCEGGREDREDVASAGRQRNRDGKIAGKHEQTRSTFEEAAKGKHQWDCSRLVEGLSKAEWAVRNISGARNYSMNLID